MDQILTTICPVCISTYSHSLTPISAPGAQNGKKIQHSQLLPTDRPSLNKEHLPNPPSKSVNSF